MVAIAHDDAVALDGELALGIGVGPLLGLDQGRGAVFGAACQQREFGDELDALDQRRVGMHHRAGMHAWLRCAPASTKCRCIFFPSA